MQQRQLGQGGPMVSAIGLGCMSFGGMYGPTGLAESLRCLDAAWDHGITFYDTANIYGMGVSETVLGEWLARRKHEIVLATKASIISGPPRRIDNSAEHLRGELEASLRRLGRERVELFYIHRRDPGVPHEALAETLERFMGEGKIGGYGLSEVAPSTIRAMHALLPCRAVQNEYSLWTRQPELGVTRACADLGIAFVPFSPLGRGIFSQEPLEQASFPPGDFRRSNPRFIAPNFEVNQRLIAGFRAFCQARGWNVAAAAMAWVLQQPGGMLPIPGTRTAEHLADWAGADALIFTPEEWAEIDRLLPPGFAQGARYGEAQRVSVEEYC
ncbi:aldo/keto reductase [Phaeovulum sp. W22_SRMD_FR3]|uniref:aldo/keto reductase n=1 Tax=Phaeovulum sp. W22_SRMD_FR3 TaxID=3240274 RepID=UPI003F99B2EA